MRIVLVLLAFAIASVAVPAADEEAKPITAAAAIQQIGQPRVYVEMIVKTAKDRLEKRGIIYLDSEADFKDAKNLGVAISAEAAAKYKKNGIADPATHFGGKTIRVRGCVMKFEERAYLPVHDPEQIVVVVEKK